MDANRPELSMEGAGAVLFDVAGTAFSDDLQARIWSLAAGMKTLEGVSEAVPGMNNLMIVFDPLALAPESVEQALLDRWNAGDAADIAGQLIEIAVDYGGAAGEDLPDFAARLGLDVEEVVRRHTAPTYSVAAVGAMPGFVYLSGLDPALATPRRAVPRMSAPVGSVMIGGAQAGIMPVTAPTGWHILGHTDRALFDPAAEVPVLCRPGIASASWRGA